MTRGSAQCGELQQLASNEFLTVERCSCGSIHIQVGGITAHVTEDGLEALAAGLGEAHSNLRAMHRSLERSLGIRFDDGIES
jgi:hypothetical protein